ncbi:5-bromo-4-chloroindolyl phosphate hydrolysis family protein [Thiohalocapsa marina]|nr:5-bromo-4-chloroindolyl phosphate hydrolysis family protein [Thiohalocapsa marina]
MNDQRPGTSGVRRPNLQALLARVRGMDLKLDLPPDTSPDASPNAHPHAPANPAPNGPQGQIGQLVPPPWQTAHQRKGYRPVLLWVLSAPLVPAAVFALGSGHLQGFLGDALGWALVAMAAVLTRLGFADAASGRERRFSRRWRLPLRNLAAVALGLGTLTVALFGVGHGLGIGIAFGALAVLGYHLAYGLEPVVAGARLGGDDMLSRQVAEALAEAEKRLINLERAAGALSNPELRLRLSRIAHEGRGMLEQIAERPSDLRRARRFLTVFLEGAEQVSDGYVRSHHHAGSDELEQNFRTVLISIEDQLIRQRARLREADVLDLDVQIEVLKKQLEQEGIR